MHTLMCDLQSCKNVSLEKMKHLISTVMMDSMKLWMIGSKLIGLELRGFVFVPFYVIYGHE